MLRNNTQNTKASLEGLPELVLELALPRNRGGALDIPAWLEGHAKGGSASALTHLGELHLGNAMTGEARTKALLMLQEAGRKGYGPAQLRIGILLALGVTGVPEPVAALPWLEQAVAQDLPEASTMLGLLYAVGDGVSKDTDMAASLFQMAAASGEMTAKRWLHDALPIVLPVLSRMILGMLRALVCAMRPLSDDSGDAELIAALAELSDDGDADASLLLGVIYTAGTQVAPDPQMADFWYTRAIEQGNSLAPLLQEPLTIAPDNIMKAPDAAIRFFTLVAQTGDPAAQFTLGVLHLMREDQEPDYAEATKWFRAAAEQGHNKAPFMLASALQDGGGGAKNEAEAVRWLRVAAEQGDADGQFMLADVLSCGRGVVTDKAEAMRWYSSAAEQGNAHASYRLAMLQSQAGDHSAAAVRMQIAAEAGHARAQAVLALWYGAGVGVDQNPEKSKHWASVAQASNSEIFFETLKIMKRD